MTEYLLTTNKFLEPTSVKGSDAYGILLTRLLLLEPGTDPLRPDKGVGLGPKYRFITENDMNNLQSRIQDQINTYLPSDFILNTKAYLELKSSGYLVITIVANDTKYVYDTESSGTPIQLSDIVS